jgi:1,2-dihydroxy-3-keto-5-methylthiopentene dioxygenase
MSELRIYSERVVAGEARPENVVTDSNAIVARLNAVDVLFEQWETTTLDESAGQDEVVEAYREPVDRLMQRYAFESLDVIAIGSNHPRKDKLRETFWHEHTHEGFEVRFFVEGEALFYIRKGGKVYGLMCARGDLIGLPAGTPHWFDMGDTPHFKAIRLFTADGGWAPRFTGDSIAGRFPRLGNETLGSAG